MEHFYAIKVRGGRWLSVPWVHSNDPLPEFASHFTGARHRRTLLVLESSAVRWLKFLEQNPERYGPYIHPLQPKIVRVRQKGNK